MPTGPRALALCLALLLPTAGRGGDWKCPARGGDEWREVSTEHFRVATDLSSGKARDLAQELETMHVAVRGALFRTPPPMPGVIRVVAFRHEDEFRGFAPEEAAAYFAVLDGEPTVVMHGDFADYTRLILAHELAHQLLARVFARQPRWFAEGLASYLETVGATPDAARRAASTADEIDRLTTRRLAESDDHASVGAGVFTVGGVPRHRHREVYPYHGGIGEVLRAKGPLAGTRQYALAWALVHFLIQSHGAEFGQLQGRLARGEDPDAAWLAVFPRWDPREEKAMGALDQEIGRHVAGGRFAYRTLPLVKDHAVSERPLSSADVHAVRLFLPRTKGGGVAPVQDEREAAEALAEDPTHVEILGYLANIKRSEGPALAARAVAAHPDSARAWLLAGRFATEAAAQEQAYRKAVELAPDSELALNGLAWQLVEAEREGEALPLARKAASIAPWSAPTLDTFAAALQGLGQCADALQVQRRAIDVLSEHVTDEGRKPYLDRLAKLEATCGPNKGSTAPAATPAPGPAVPASPVSSQPRP